MVQNWTFQLQILPNNNYLSPFFTVSTSVYCIRRLLVITSINRRRNIFKSHEKYIHFNRGCLVRFTHMWYQISPCSWLGFWHLPQFKLRLGNHISDLRSQNWGQHSGFSEENRPKVGFFWKFQKMQFPAFGFKKWDFFWVWGVEKGPTNFFPCQKA